LTVHEQTPLFYRIKRKELALPRDERIVVTYEKTVAFLRHYGFQQYEISNFAQEGHESLHNRAYWDRRAYKGFGIGEKIDN